MRSSPTPDAPYTRRTTSNISSRPGPVFLPGCSSTAHRRCRSDCSAALHTYSVSGAMSQPAPASSPQPSARGWGWLHPLRSMGLLPQLQQQKQQQQQAGFLERLFASSQADAAVASRPQQDGVGPSHLVVMVNGLFGGPGNWDVIGEQLAQHLDPHQTLLHASTANSRFATYDGIDSCGCRLADEVRGLVAAQPSLSRISIVAHSMGGLMARYAIGQLYNPASRTICGLQPAHFVTLATPHCGCDADGVAQVPFIGWTNELPLLGGKLFSFLQGISGPTAALLFRRTGQQFFMQDGKQQQQQQALAASSSASMADGGSGNGNSSSSSSSSGDLPVLLQLTQDCPDRGLFFYSALAAFQTRTCYANTGADHLVGYANSSLRSLGQLPPLPPAAASAKGVVLEDPLTAAFFPQRWQHLQQHCSHHQQQQQRLDAPNASTGTAARAAGSVASVPLVCELLTQPYQPSRTWPTPPPQAAAAAAAAGSPAWHEISNSKGSGRQELPITAGRWVPVQQQQQQDARPATVAALELAAAGAAVAATEAVADLLGAPAAGGQEQGLAESPAGGSPRKAMAGPAAAAAAAADSGDELMQLQAAPALLGSSSSSTHSDGANGASGAAAAAAAAEADLASGLSGAGTAAAASSESAADAVAADVATLAAAGASRAQLVAHMLHRLQELPWRRIDVSFQGARFGFAHNNIQVTRRWLNFEGVAVPCHLAQQLQLMEALVAPAATQAQQPAAAVLAWVDRGSRVVNKEGKNAAGMQASVPAAAGAAGDIDVTDAAVV